MTDENDDKVSIAALPEINYDELDPNIRETVRMLRERGFNTTDSGDGSKVGWMEGAVEFPMIAIRIENPEHLTMHARRLHRILSMGHKVRFGVDVYEGKDSAPMIEATYDPVLNVALIILTNVDDSMLKKE